MKKGLLLLFSAMLVTGGVVFGGTDLEEFKSSASGPDTCTPANCPGSGTNCCKNSAGSTIYKGKDQ